MNETNKPTRSGLVEREPAPQIRDHTPQISLRVAPSTLQIKQREADQIAVKINRELAEARKLLDPRTGKPLRGSEMKYERRMKNARHQKVILDGHMKLSELMLKNEAETPPVTVADSLREELGFQERAREQKHEDAMKKRHGVR